MVRPTSPRVSDTWRPSDGEPPRERVVPLADVDENHPGHRPARHPHEPPGQWHPWAADVFGSIAPPLWTCEAVLTEASHLTGRPAEIISKVASGVLRIGLDAGQDAARLERLLAQYGPRMDFADACIVRMSERFAACKVLTLDRRDFAVYRRNGRDVIPLIAP